MPKVVKLVVNCCMVHKDALSVTIEDERGGVRLTKTKCCGRWREIGSWTLTPQMCDDAIRQFENAKEELARELT